MHLPQKREVWLVHFLLVLSAGNECDRMYVSNDFRTRNASQSSTPSQINMWTQMPADLVLHIGAFTGHRDARCMQSTCTSWEKIWTLAHLSVPHPAVQSIDVCGQEFCCNRQYVMDAFEPLMLPVADQPDGVLRLLSFMTLLLPLLGTKYMASLVEWHEMEERLLMLGQSLTFWCNCDRHIKSTTKVPAVHLQSDTDEIPYSHHTKQPNMTDTESLFIWCIIAVICSIPLLPMICFLILVPCIVCCTGAIVYYILMLACDGSELNIPGIE